MPTAYCFDLDGTITKDEILPILSREIGLFEEIAALTEATVQGVIPFRRSFLLRCRLLGEIPVSRVQEIIAKVRMNEEILAFIRRNKDNCFVITGNLDAWVAPLVETVGCRFFCSNANVDGDRLTGVGHVLNKADAVAEIRPNYEKIVAIGDGMGDVQMFEQSDVRVAFGGTHRPIQTLLQLAHFVSFNERSLCNLLNTL
jgi:HAD superfamily phosphoserine phosphatase-like hydrolase